MDQDSTEQGVDHSEDIEQQDLSLDDFTKLTSLMDSSGSLPPHGEADDSEPENNADDSAEPVPEPEAEEPKGQPELEEVEYEGKKYTIPPEIKGALLRQADYTRKTQEVASERAAAQQDRQTSQALMQQAEQYVDQIAAIKQIDAQIAQLQQVNWNELQATDPIRDLQLRAAYGELIRGRGDALSQLQAARQYSAQVSLQSMAKSLQEGQEVLAREIPNWGADTQKALRDTAESLGYKADELAQVTDPRAVKVLHRLYTAEAKLKEYESKRETAQKRVQQAPPKPVRSSASREVSEAPVAAKEIARLRRSGSDADAISALLKLPIG